MKPKQQAAVLRQVATDLEQGKCSPSFLAAVLTGLLGEDRAPRATLKKRSKKRKP